MNYEQLGWVELDLEKGEQVVDWRENNHEKRVDSHCTVTHALP